MVFVKAMKALALAGAVMPVMGCAVGVGLIFSALIGGVAISPDVEDTLFSHAMLGFALVETFLVVIVAVLGMVFVS